MFDLVDTQSLQAEIKVFGVGGAGGNAIDHMMEANIEGVTFINANTDAQVLERSKADLILQLGENLTKGLGAGANPEVGRDAALEDRDRISEAIEGADMIFITAGMGGGTGTGAAPVVAELAKEKGILTVAVVTKPFTFEGAKRGCTAQSGLEELKQHVDSLITIPNEKVLEHMGGDATLDKAFGEANKVLQNAVQGIAELITRPGMMNVDFADVRTVMSEMGMAMMGSAVASGEGRAEKATKNAISSPLLEDIDLHGARGLLVNVTAGRDLTIGEFSKVGTILHEFVGEDANVVIGSAYDDAMDGSLRVTVVATGLGQAHAAALNAPETQPVSTPRVPERAVRVVRRGEQTAAARPGVRHQPDPRLPKQASLVDEQVAADSGQPFEVPEKPQVFQTKMRASGGGGADFDELQIPTYLRRQQAD